jgi:polyisoprenoid-binding protein YceI
MKMKISVLLAGLAFASAAIAAPQTFDFKDPKSVNTALFHLDAPLESINGSANGISGTVTFDPEKPADTKGKIVITTASLTVPNSMMNGHLHSPLWLDAAKYPEISFDVKELKNVKTADDVTTADAIGTFTCKDVSKEMTVPIKLTYLKGKLAQRLQGMPGNHEGDLLVARANFSIKRDDFHINAGNGEDKVSNEIQLTVAIAGASAK